MKKAVFVLLISFLLVMWVIFPASLSAKAEDAAYEVMMRAEVIRAPENGEYYVYDMAADKSEEIYLRITLHNQGSIPVERGILTVSAGSEPETAEILFQKEMKASLEPGKSTVIGNEYASPAVIRFGKTAAKEESLYVLVRYEAWPEDTSFESPVVQEEKLELAVGYGTRSDGSAESGMESMERDPSILKIGSFSMGVKELILIAVVLGAAIFAAVMAGRRNKTERNVRVQGAAEHLNAIPTPISRAGSGGPGTAMMENVTVTFTRENGSSFSLLCSREDAPALIPGTTGKVTYRGSELVSFERSAE